jgi:flavin-dependent dehydrogenase
MTEVIIVGAGPAGAALATELADRSIETLLLDKAIFPREKVCGDYLSPGTIQHFERLGLLDAILASGARQLRGMTIVAPDGTSFEAEYPTSAKSAGMPPYALAIPRITLDALLLERARRSGVKCVEGFRVTDLVWDGARVSGVRGIGPKGSETFRGKIVAGAEGRASIVARRLGLHRPHPTLDRMALVAYYQGDSKLGDRGLISIGSGTYCILNPLAERWTNASIVLDHAVVRRWRGRLEPLFEQKLAEFPSARKPLRGTSRAGRVRCLGPLAFRVSRRTKAGALLVGDAAGFYDPFTGTGVYQALQSAERAAQWITRALSERNPMVTLSDRLKHGRELQPPPERFPSAIQAILRRPKVANAVGHFLQRRKPLANLTLGAIGDSISFHALLSFDSLRSMFAEPER